jgi:hypothetical protein
MTIQQPWWPAVWPANDSVHINKEQAATLISLAMTVDGEDPPANIQLKKANGDTSYRGGVAVSSKWALSPSCKSEIYRPYCEALWKRCSDSVKLLYMLMGLSPAVQYMLSIVTGIERLKHGSKEIQDDWGKCVVCLLTAVENLTLVRDKTAKDSLLPYIQTPGGTRESMRVDNDKFREARERIPDKELPQIDDARKKRFRELLGALPNQLNDYYSNIDELPEPSKDLVVGTAMPEGSRTADAMALAMLDPIWAGVPPYNAVLSDKVWVHLNILLMEQLGPEQWLVNLLHLLRHTYGYHFDFDEDEVEEYDAKEEKGEAAEGAGSD